VCTVASVALLPFTIDVIANLLRDSPPLSVEVEPIHPWMDIGRTAVEPHSLDIGHVCPLSPNVRQNTGPISEPQCVNS
jgi:hypothetical protein